MICALAGGRGASKRSQKKQNQMISIRDKEVKK